MKRVIGSLRAHIHAHTYTATLKNRVVQSACRTEVSVEDMSDKEPAESEELIKVEKLGPNSREINVVVKVVSKSEVRNVTGRDYSIHRVADALVGDETGSVVLTLWDDNIDKITEEATLRITNGYVNLFRGNMRLNIGRYGSFQLLEETPITEINTENNLSEKRYEQERRYRSDRPRYGGRRDYQRRRY